MAITSLQNAKVKRARLLLMQRAARQSENTFVAEGVRLCEEALQAGCKPQIVFFAENLSPRGRKILAGFEQMGSEIEEVSQQVMNSLSDTETPQGMAAVFAIEPPPLPKYLDFVLICDGLKDPGNLGTILRSALAAGCQAVFLTPGSIDPYAPKVVRAAMGAHFRLPVKIEGWKSIIDHCKSKSDPPLRLYLAETGGEKSCWQADFCHPLGLVIGGEPAGSGLNARQAADELIAIPMPGGTESLNAAVAASILLFEVLRQRSA